MQLYFFLGGLAVVHLLVGGFGSLVITNLVSADLAPSYGDSARGFAPDSDSAYAAFGNFLYGDGSPSRTDPGEQGGVGLVRYGLTEGVCIASSAVKTGIIITTFAYPITQTIPAEGFGIWILMAIHAGSMAAFVALIFLLLDTPFILALLSNIYVLIAVGVLSSIGIISTIVAEAGNLAC